MGDHRFVFDLDDADFHVDYLREETIKACSKAKGVIAGSCYVAQWASQYNDNVTTIWTGTKITGHNRRPHINRHMIIAWAQAYPSHYPLEFQFVERIIIALSMKRKDFIFRIYGWSSDQSESMLDNITNNGIKVEKIQPLSYERFIETLNDVSIGLSVIDRRNKFSRGKSFGKILAYIDAGAVVVTSDEADHAILFDADSGIISNDEETWLSAINTMLDDPDARQAMSDRAFSKMETHLSIERAASNVDVFLRKII